MPRLTLIVCSGFALLTTVATQAQLPKNPTILQVVGYLCEQSRQWQNEQHPANSFFYPVGLKYNPWQMQIGYSNTDIISFRNGNNFQKPVKYTPTIYDKYSYLNSYITQKIERPISQPVWRNPTPANGLGASILRDIYLSKRR